MMIYIHDHFAEKISVRDLAAAAFLSERECYRVFQNCLHMTPTEYLTSIRLQMTCRMLAETRESVTDIGHACGLGSSSYFGRHFGNTQDIRLWSTAANGRIMIKADRKGIFHRMRNFYNYCNRKYKKTDLQLRRFRYDKVKILNMKSFLKVVNQCVGRIMVVSPDGKRTISMAAPVFSVSCRQSISRMGSACPLLFRHLMQRILKDCSQ